MLELVKNSLTISYNYLKKTPTVPFFLISSSVMIYSFFSLEFLINYFSKKFKSLEQKRKYYVVSNILKSGVLCGLSALSYNVLFGGDSILYLDVIDIPRPTVQLIKNVSCLYTITDIIPTIMNREVMMKSTIIHHLCVMGAYAYISLSPWKLEGIERGLFMYGIFSSYAFLVNFFLGARYLFDKKDTTILDNPTIKQKIYRGIKKTSLVTYALSCGVNWVWQLKYFSSLVVNKFKMNGFSPYLLVDSSLLGLYLVMIYNWILDDKILMYYLSK